MVSIEITNVQDNTVLPHPLVVLDGRITDFASLGLTDPLQWFITASVDFQAGLAWPVAASGRFKAFVQLPTGQHTITLKLGTSVQRSLVLSYQPVATNNIVRFYYQKCSDASDNEGFDAPPGVDNSDNAALQRVRFAALLMQTAMAEMLVNAGQPRRTFAVEWAADGLPEARLLRSTFTNATARGGTDQDLFALVAKDLQGLGFNTHPTLVFKHAVITGCSKYNKATQKPEGYLALGGGMAGMFGSCTIHAWPRRLNELSATVLNNNRIDKTQLLEDGGGRLTYWANFATGIGAFIHELGHAFGLPHTPTGIMGRGFDDMNRLFSIHQADFYQDKPAYSKKSVDGRLVLDQSVLAEVTAPDGANWHPDSVALLAASPFIVPEDKREGVAMVAPQELPVPLP